jgi:hypothetical protein
LDLVEDLLGTPLSRAYLISLYDNISGWETRSAIVGVDFAAGVEWVGPESAGEPTDIEPEDRRTYLVPT